MFINKLVGFMLLVVCSFEAVAQSDAELAVWANEAIVATYTFDFQDFLNQQKQIAKYFTAAGWANYATAFNSAKLPDAVQKNKYFVTAVALMPPTIKNIRPNHWQAVMPTLVVYTNPAYQQKQTLEVTINFEAVPAGQGIRGLAIDSFQTNVITPPCECKPSSPAITLPN